MSDQDVELLEAIVNVLDDRKARAMARLLHAVQDTKPTEKLNKGGLMAKAAEKAKPNVKGSMPDSEDGDEFEDDDFEDDDLDEDEDFEDDDDIDDDDFYEDDDDFDYDDD